MIRCPSCGRRLRDDAPVCPVTHGAPPPAPPPAEDAADAFRRADAGPAGVPRQQDAGAGRLRRGVPGRARLRRTTGRDQGRARRQRVGQRALLREAEALVDGRRPARARRLRARPAADGSAYVVMEFVRPRSSRRWRRCRGRWTIDEVRHAPRCSCRGGRARARARSLRPQAGERVRRRQLGAKLFDFGLVRKLGASPREATKEEAPAGRPSTCRPSSARGASTSTRAATSMRWA